MEYAIDAMPEGLNHGISINVDIDLAFGFGFVFLVSEKKVVIGSVIQKHCFQLLQYCKCCLYAYLGLNGIS